MHTISLEDQSEFEDDIVLAAERHERKSYRSNGAYTRVFHHGAFTVKYTDHVVLKTECLALQRLHALAAQDAGGPHVPRVAHYFHRPNLLGYILMDRIEVCAVSDDELCRQAARAVLWLRAQRVNAFGSLGGGKLSHTVFQRGTAPRAFTSAQAAQIYLNVALDRIRARPQRWRSPLADIDFAGDVVVLTQADMHAGNFGVHPDGRPVLFDAATIQAHPTVLADYTLLRASEFSRAVAAHVFTHEEIAELLASPSFASLAAIRKHLFMGDDGLGVDKDGNVRPTRIPGGLAKAKISVDLPVPVLAGD